MHISRRTTATLTTLGALTAAIALAAPGAGAAVTRIDVATGTSFGSSAPYGTGCSYTVTATAQPGKAVAFYEADDQGTGTRDTFKPEAPKVDASGKATTVWTPKTKGQHKIYAQEYPTGDATFTVTVNVGTGVNLGPVCLVLP